MWKYYNANPYKRRIDDCFLRCMAVLTNRTWLDIYNEVSNLSGRQGRLFSDVQFVEDYLDDRYNRECNSFLTVGEFAKKHPYRKLCCYYEWAHNRYYKWRNN